MGWDQAVSCDSRGSSAMFRSPVHIPDARNNFMERMHQNNLRKKFRAHRDGKRLICMGISDEYAHMDPELVALLEAKVARHLTGLMKAVQSGKSIYR